MQLFDHGLSLCTLESAYVVVRSVSECRIDEVLRVAALVGDHAVERQVEVGICDICRVRILFDSEFGVDSYSLELLLHENAESVERTCSIVSDRDLERLAVLLIDAVRVQRISVCLDEFLGLCRVYRRDGHLAVSSRIRERAVSGADRALEVLSDGVLIYCKVDGLSQVGVEPVLVEDVVLESCARHGLDLVLVRVLLVNFESRGAYAVVAVDLSALHREQLRIVFLHVVEDRSIEVHIAVPVILVLRDRNVSFRLELADHERAGADRCLVEVLCSVEIYHAALRARKVVLEHRRRSVSGIDCDRLVVNGSPCELVEVSVLCHPLVFLAQSLDVLDDHVCCQRIAVRERDTVLELDCPDVSVNFSALGQAWHHFGVLVELEQCFGDAVNGCVPSVVLLVDVQARISERRGSAQRVVIRSAGRSFSSSAGSHAEHHA